MQPHSDNPIDPQRPAPHQKRPRALDVIQSNSTKHSRTRSEPGQEIRLVIMPVPASEAGKVDLEKAAESFTRTVARTIAVEILEEQGRTAAAARLRNEKQ
jgi:hypothetical protein